MFIVNCADWVCKECASPERSQTSAISSEFFSAYGIGWNQGLFQTIDKYYSMWYIQNGVKSVIRPDRTFSVEFLDSQWGLFGQVP